jgi:hypothetical protein
MPGQIVLTAASSGTVTLTPADTGNAFVSTIPARTGNIAVDGPAFSAYKNDGAQGVTSATFTKITFNTEFFDTNNNFASSRFTPTVAGYYQLNAGASTFGGSAATRMIITVYQNGSSLFTLYDVTNSAPGRGSGSVLVYANGTTDYFEIYGYLTTGSGLAFESGYGGAGYQTWFNGCLLRGA